MIFIILFSLVNLFTLNKVFEPWGDEVFFTEPSLSVNYGTAMYPPVDGLENISHLYGKAYLFINDMIFTRFGYNLVTMRLQSFVFGIGTIVLLYAMTQSYWPVLFCCSYFFIRALHCARPEMGIVFWVTFSLFFIQKKRTFLAGLTSSLPLFWHVPSGLIGICVILGFVLALSSEY